jgi:cytochrome c-type biogenesis protein CcmH
MIRIALAALLMLGSVAWAVQPEEQLADKQLEGRARTISAGLRCLVCQNQSIDDSDAPLAHDLRVLVRQRLQAGDSDEAARDFIVARYGQYVLLRPRFDAATALLWLTPLIVLVLGGLIAIRHRSRGAVDAVPLSPEEERALSCIVAAEGPVVPADREAPKLTAN